MCDPATIALIISTTGVLSAGNDARNQADFQAATLTQQATREREIATQEEIDLRRRNSRTAAAGRAAGGASGVDFSTGTPLLAAADFAAEAELQALRIRSGGATSATRLRQQASLTSAAGKSAQTASFFQAGSSLLTGFDKQFGTKTPPKTK